MKEQENFCRILEGELNNYIRGLILGGFLIFCITNITGCTKNKENDEKTEKKENVSYNTDNPKDSYINETVNRIKSKKIIFDMGDDENEVIKSPLIDEWIVVKDDKVTLDDEKVEEWVETFSKKYDTEGMSRVFTTHDGKTITIEGGDYGWKMDCDKIEESIEEFLCRPDGKATKTMKPAYVQEAFKQKREQEDVDWDVDNYSEIDLSKQMVYVFKDGELVYQCKCVTGLKSDEERRTKTGCYYVKEKKEDYILTGEDYSISTKYWIRITWSGTGYHYMNRSDWDEWSPSIYKTKGSHGCINLKFEDAKKIYKLITFHDAVFIHE